MEVNQETDLVMKNILNQLNEFEKVITNQNNVIEFLKQEIIKRNTDIMCLNYINFSNIYNEKIKFPKSKNPIISIVIPVYNQYQYTKTCLYQISQTVKNFDYEIIIADDCSNDNTVKILDEVENIKVIKTNTNLGFLKNVNNAVKEAKGKYVCLLNNDTIPLNNWLDNLLEIIEKDKTVGIVGAKYLHANHSIQEAGAKIYFNGQPNCYGYLKERNSAEHNFEREVDYCSGCGILIRKEAWDAIGGFDEQFSPAYYEDSDLAFSFRHKLGLKVIYQPKSEIVHLLNVTYKHTNYNEAVNVNKIKFCQKWANELKQERYRTN